jgi:hypothetical protein
MANEHLNGTALDKYADRWTLFKSSLEYSNKIYHCHQKVSTQFYSKHFDSRFAEMSWGTFQANATTIVSDDRR